MRPLTQPNHLLQAMQEIVSVPARFAKIVYGEGFADSLNVSHSPRIMDPVTADGALTVVTGHIHTPHLYFVSEDMTALAMAAGAQLPDEHVPHEDDMPSPSGFMLFGKELARFHPRDSDDLEETVIKAISWRTQPHRNGRKWLEFILWDAVDEGMWHPGTDRRIIPLYPRLIPHTGGIGTLLAPDEDLSVEQIQIVKTPLLPVNHAVFAAWLLMKQPLTTVTPAETDRATRRRAYRAGVAGAARDGGVVYVHVRRPPAKPREDSEANKVDWSCSWMVSGHWQKFACGPNRSERRLRYVMPYLKDPGGGKPLRVKEKVVVWDR